MSSKYCSSCTQKRPLLSFLKDTLASPNSRVFATCINCRVAKKKRTNKKRAALQSLDPNIQPAKRVRDSNTGPQPIIQAPPNPPSILPNLLESCLDPRPTPPPPTQLSHPQSPIRVPTPLPAQPEPGYLPSDQWQWIQGFHKAMAAVEMETCSRCKERWFSMDLKDNVCHSCFLRDKRNRTPFLMSAENDMDPGELLAHLPELTQVEEMIIARSHVQMLVHHYYYYYSFYCAV
jgi:hypothetical protein